MSEEINTSNIVRHKRESLNLSQKDFASMIGLGVNGDRTIRRWEAGETSPSKIELEYIKKINSLPPFPNDENARYKMIDLFAGIGGTRLGFQLTGATKVVFTSEIDKYAKQTYISNFGDEVHGDITQIEASEIPEHDILVGGFPCQAFSQAGKKLGFEDSRGTLFFDIARILKEKRPKAFLLENVKNLQSHDKGKTLKVILGVLEELNYEVSYKVLRARDFGVPQNRERIYIVGFDRETVKNYKDFTMPIPPMIPTKVGDILESNVDTKYTISDRLWEGHQRRKLEHKEKGNGFGYSLFNQDSEYTNTISARYYKDGSEILIEQVGKNPRKLTPREAARLQGFPEEFQIVVSDTQAYRQFGNSVSVPVVKAIAEQMFKVLDSNLPNADKVCIYSD